MLRFQNLKNSYSCEVNKLKIKQLCQDVFEKPNQYTHGKTKHGKEFNSIDSWVMCTLKYI